MPHWHRNQTDPKGKKGYGAFMTQDRDGDPFSRHTDQLHQNRPTEDGQRMVRNEGLGIDFNGVCEPLGYCSQSKWGLDYTLKEP